MLELKSHLENRFPAAARAIAAALGRGLVKAAARIRRTAIGEIETSPDPSEAGSPPHTRRGQLPRAILFDVDRAAAIAVIGPVASQVGASGKAHEFGGEFRGDAFEPRPFMGPALDANLEQIPAGLDGEVRE